MSLLNTTMVKWRVGESRTAKELRSRLWSAYSILCSTYYVGLLTCLGKMWKCRNFYHFTSSSSVEKNAPGAFNLRFPCAISQKNFLDSNPTFMQILRQLQLEFLRMVVVGLHSILIVRFLTFEALITWNFWCIFCCHFISYFIQSISIESFMKS